MDYSAQIAKTLKIDTAQVAAAVSLFDEGSTVPFIARYRKDKTGGLDEITTARHSHRNDYLKELVERNRRLSNRFRSRGR